LDIIINFNEAKDLNWLVSNMGEAKWRRQVFIEFIFNDGEFNITELVLPKSPL
jgi:hypothetical protein